MNHHPSVSILIRAIRVASPGIVLAASFAFAQTGSRTTKATPPQTSTAPQTSPGASKPAAGTAALASVDGIPITETEWDRLAKPYFEEIEARAGRPLNEEEKKLLQVMPGKIFYRQYIFIYY